ncbi:MAG: two-component system sensor histidine kinase NtrB, partial [Deferrisomatales bacterium]
MPEPLRILIVEDLPTDADLAEREIRQVFASCEFRRVETPDRYLEALGDFRPDLIVSDFKLPRFDGLTALRLAHQHAPLTPVVILTGSMNEDTAVACMKAGAADYVLKEHVRRLGQAVVGALDQQRLRAEKRQADEALRASEARHHELARQFGAVLDAIPDTIALLSPGLEILWANRAAAQDAGREAAEIAGQRCHAVWFGRSTPCDPCPAVRSLRAGTPELEVVTSPEGRVVELRAVPLADEAGRVSHVLRIGRDLTEHRRLEDELRQAQKMEAVGRLAGGVAHDFNNMLGVILGYAELAGAQLDPADPLHPKLQEIRRAAERSAALTRQLLAFARKQAVSPRPLDLNQAVSQTSGLLKRLIGEDIELRWQPAEDLWPVHLDPSQLDQILANLVVNARDAIPGVGTVLIETYNAVLDEAYCAAHPGAAPGEYAVLAVTDTGEGMGPETRSHLFEPFFTTKGEGRGTGLGLATVYGIVTQNGGSIHVRSAPGQGATFRIYLP